MVGSVLVLDFPTVPTLYGSDCLSPFRGSANEKLRKCINDSETKPVVISPIISPDLESGKLSLGFTCDADAYGRLYD